MVLLFQPNTSVIDADVRNSWLQSMIAFQPSWSATAHSSHCSVSGPFATIPLSMVHSHLYLVLGNHLDNHLWEDHSHLAQILHDLEVHHDHRDLLLSVQANLFALARPRSSVLAGSLLFQVEICFHLQVSSAKETLVQNEGLSNQIWLGELHICIPARYRQHSISCQVA